MREWMKRVWSIVRIPVAEGLVCYGPDEGNQATFIRTEHWLPRQRPMDELPAQKELLRKYLRAYGPATLQDFAHWSGISMAEVRPLKPLLDAELADHNGLLVLREDLKHLEGDGCDLKSVHLLPYFDVYLLAHSLKDHLLESRKYKRVYRNQGWISPVLLIDGRIAGVWGYELSRQRINIEVESFARIDSSARAQIQVHAQALGEFFQRTSSLSFKN
jgi:hypothetical protein